MKNAIFTGSRKNKLASVGMISVILISVLFLSGCFDFEFINQPYQADPNSSFEVEVSAWASSQEGAREKPYFGILLPLGWEVEDSIEYAGITYAETGMLIYSDSLSQAMTTIDPPPDGYYWWVAADTILIGGDTYDFDFHIYTDNQTGSFLLDYMLGSDWHGLNYRRSNEHLIIVGGVILSNQSDIDNFPINFPNCGEFAGEIIISGDDITNLDGLNALTSISGSLWFFDNASLTSLTGMVNLTSIGGTFSVNGNQSLHYIQGLNNLTSVGRYLLIEDNAELVNISGLNALTDIGIDMSLRNNSLISFTGMNNLLSIGRNLIIEDNGALNSLVGMNNLTSIGGNLSIRNNSTLNNLTGLNTLTSIGGYFDIYSNSSLTSLFGLENMTSIGGYLNIYYNDTLNSLTGLEGLTSIGGGLSINNNPLLCHCEVDAICAYLADPTGTISIYGNASGCSSLVDVAVSCGTTLSCLEEGTYNLYSQFDVDNFPAVFPGCTEILCNFNINGDDITNLDSLAAITSIGGYLRIYENVALGNLTGLEGLTSVGGYLSISSNDALTSLEGLEGLSSIGGNLRISSNDALTNLTGLDNVTAIGGYLSISSNDALTSLTGLDNVTAIGGYLEIWGNYSLISLTGLDNVTSIGGYLKIYNNDALVSMTGLEGLSSIGGNLEIHNSASLTSLAGLESLTSIGGDLTIIDNPLLCNCEVDAICTYLSDPNGYISIYYNGVGCSGVIELAVACGTTLPCLEEGTYNLYSQFAVDHFPAVFPGCSDILCNVNIHGDDITNLDSLACISSILGSLHINYTSSLASLSGLEGLTSIGDYLEIHYNDSLTSFVGLENVTSIGGDLSISDNDALVSLTGLEGLSSIGGYLSISSNDALGSLAGLEGLSSIGGDLTIRYNPLLCNCEVDAICSYLSDPNGNMNIHSNGTGCSSLIEVAASCGTTIPCLEEGTYELTNQFAVDHFPAVFPGCSDILCNVNIYGDDITNLDSLACISSILGSLHINYTSSLASLSGLESLTYIGDYLSISSNASLTSLTGLDGLASIDGNLLIYSNPLLSICDIDAICAYLADTSGTVNIYNNAPGCDSEEEVEAACLGVGVDESSVDSRQSSVVSRQSSVRVYPNPFTDKITVDCSGIGTGVELVEIYNLFGARVGEYRVNGKDPMMTFDMTGLPAGLYFCKIQLGQQVVMQKIVKL